MPPLRKLGLSLNPTSWTVKDVCKVLKAVNLGEYMELFVEHRVQGDVLFSLTEENLKEMGVGKVGDRLLITDITQTLYEQITGWQQQQVKQQNLPAGARIVRRRPRHPSPSLPPLPVHVFHERAHGVPPGHGGRRESFAEPSRRG